ncbi:MAG: winged helix-turn-helix domain-containing protein, partial [Spirochaetales bacterium]
PPRAAFEYWAHAAAYLPLDDYRYCLPRMRRIAAQGHEWFPHDQAMVNLVRERIKSEGPLRSQDFQSEGNRGPWWDWKPAKAALEFLFQSGELMVTARPGFQKLYDLRERVLPEDTDTRYPDDDEMADWYVWRAALAMGAFSERDIAYLRKDGATGIKRALERAVEAGRLIKVQVDGEPNRSHWIDPVTLESAKRWSALRYRASGQPFLGEAPRPVRILSPFDNLIIDRKRSQRVLELDYTIECYVPAAKRRFGYFALPVFLHERPVGLVDCKARRKEGVMSVLRSSFRFSPDGEDYTMRQLERAERDGAAPEGFAMAVSSELSAFTEFNGCPSMDSGQ